jgi:DNA-directed RNA polymerase subunit RPC12/RpoP
MSDSELSKGLNCPRCGGVVSIPEGQVIVRCPSCDFRSIVRGDVGVRRYQVPMRAGRDQALRALGQFFSNWAIARDVRSQARVSEVFLAYLPFWTLWGRALGWAFGEKSVGSGKSQHYEPREVKITQEMVWTGAACDVGEFGVNQVQLTNQPLDPFNGDALHASGMVFEPVGSLSDARQAAEQDFQKKVSAAANLDRLSQLFVRFVNQRFGLVYYPLWVVRYLYRGRAFQVVVDGFSGKVLYGKAPGNSLYRAAMLVGGMAAGAFLAVDVPTFLLMAVGSSHSSKGDSGLLVFALGALAVGFGLIAFAYRTFRYGENYEYGGAKFNMKQLTDSNYGELFKVAMTAIDSNGRSVLR